MSYHTIPYIPNFPHHTERKNLIGGGTNIFPFLEPAPEWCFKAFMHTYLWEFTFNVFMHNGHNGHTYGLKDGICEFVYYTMLDLLYYTILYYTILYYTTHPHPPTHTHPPCHPHPHPQRRETRQVMRQHMRCGLLVFCWYCVGLWVGWLDGWVGWGGAGLDE